MSAAKCKRALAGLFRAEQATEAREAEPLLAAREREEDDLQTLPPVAMAVPRRAADRRLAARRPSTPRRKAGEQQVSCLGQQLAVLGDGEEDQAIDKPQQLAEEVAEREFALRRRAHEVMGSHSETHCRALATPPRRRHEADRARRALPCSPFRAIAQSAIGRRRAGRAKPARMDEQPERREIREAVSLKNLP